MTTRGIDAVVVRLHDRLLRLDAGEAEPCLDRSIPANTPLADSLEQALSVAPAPRRVLVVTDRVFTQTVALKERIVDGLDAAQLAKALAYELEPISSIRAADAAIASRPLHVVGEDRIVWATAIRATERSAVDAVAARFKCALIGIVHPAGLVPVTGPCVQVFADSTLRATNDGIAEVLAARPEQRSWATALRAALAADDTAVAWGGCVRPSSLGADVTVAIDDRGVLDILAIARSAHDALRTTALHVPMIPPPQRPRAPPKPATIGTIAALLVAAVVAYDAWSLQREVSHLEAEAKVATEKSAAVGRQNIAVTALKSAIAKLTDDGARERPLLDALERDFERQSARLSKLLAATSRLLPESLLLNTIDSDSDGNEVLAGFALDPAAVDRFADELDRELRTAGWRIRPAITERAPEDGNGVYRFRVAALPDFDARGAGGGT